MTIEGYKISSQQARVWLRNPVQGQRDAHCDLLLEGPLEANRLRKTVEQLVQRHEILSTLFQIEAGMLLPLQNPVASPQTLFSQTETLAERAQAMPFRIEAEVPFCATLARVSESTHRLRLSLPSLCIDHRSFAILARELLALYAGTELDEVAQFLDYSEWQHELLEDEEKVRLGQSFWRRNAGAIANATVQPPSDGYERHECLLPAATHTERELLGAWFALMFRLESTETLTVSTLFQARDIEDLADTVGLISTLAPVSLSVPEGVRLSEVLAAVKSAHDTAQGYLTYLATETTIPERALEFEYIPAMEISTGGGLQARRLDQVIHYQPFQLKLSCLADMDGLHLRFFYHPKHYSSARIALLAEAFTNLLQRIADPSLKLAVTPLVGEQQRQLLASFNATEKPFMRDICLHQVIEAQVERTPEHCAVRHGDTQLTYRDLNSFANRLARQLVAKGAGPEVLVALCLDRTPDLIIGVLAALKSGAAYIGIDPAHPKQRVRDMCRDARLFLANPEHAPHLGVADGVIFDDDWRGSIPEDEHNLDLSLDPGYSAYVIFTSGSTGRPKGVVLPHRTVLNYLTWALEAYPQDRGWGATLHSSMGFDLTVTSLYLPLMTGGCLMLVPERDSFDELNRILTHYQRFSLLKLTPSHLKLLDRLEVSEAIAAAGGAESTQGTVVLGGEQLYGEDLKRWQESLPLTRVINEYGPTEAAVGCCVFEADRPISGPVPIGRPIANTRLHILDAALNQVPCDVIGELFIAGESLARGYLGRPAQTAERFIPDPFAIAPGARMYRTGDHVRLQSHDLQLAFIGRVDAQVKVRGYRIELGEIDSVLKNCPLVEDGVVQVLKRGDEARLVAYVCERGRAAMGSGPALGVRLTHTEALRAFMAERLPEYMIPTAFVGMVALPLTHNGKVAYDQLPVPDSSRPGLDKPYQAPRNPLEETLCQAWQKALGLDRIGIHDNFFSLGGDSIRSVSAVAGAKALGVEHTVQTLFRNPTIEALAAAIGDDAGSAQQELEEIGGYRPTQPFQLISDEDRAKLPPGIEDAYPLSAVQLGMLFHMLETNNLPSPPSYHNVNTYRVQVPFNEATFLAAVAKVVARHAILRTSFELTSFSTPMQLIHQHAVLETIVEDLRHLPSEEQERVVDAYIHEENFRLVDTTVPSMLHFYIHWLEDDVISLTLTEPHSLGDGWSTHLHLIEIFRNHLAMMRGDADPDHTPLALTYRDFIDMEMRAMASPEARDYWMRLLERCESTELPPLARESEAYGIHDHRISFVLPTDTLAGLHRLAHHAGVPFKTVLLTAHLKVLSMLCGQDRVTTGLAFNGRPEVPGGDQLRGLFLNTMPFPFDLGQDSFPDLVRRVFATETEMLRFRRFPISVLQSGRRQLFTTLFSLHNFHSVGEILNDPDLKVLSTGDLSKTNYEIAIFFHISEAHLNSVTLTIEGNLDRISNRQLHSLHDYFVQVLSAMGRCTNHSETIKASHQLSHYLTSSEVSWLRQRNPLPTPVSSGPCLHNMVEAAVAHYPTRLAVQGENLALTYAELDSKANDIAAALRRLGVGRGQQVAVSIRRSPETLVALLGILKAGAAYVPIDADNPPERIGYMLETTHTAVVLTQPEVLGRYGGNSELAGLAIDSQGVLVPEFLERAAEARSAFKPTCSSASALDLAYLIFTSGSTGKPKAVAVPHAGVVNFMTSMAKVPGMSANDRLLALTNISFDIACLELFLPLTVGGTVCVVPDEVANDGFKLVEALDRLEATVAQATPSTWRMALAAGWQGRPGLRIFSGGEALPADLAQRLLPLVASITNLYGPTETTIWSTQTQLNSTDVHIGTPIANTQVHVLNRYMQPAPIGSSGELFIGGLGVTRGYYGRPALTAKAFVPDPFSDQQGARLYRTGDRVYFRERGELGFVSRIDFQVKLRGFRIELGEIEVLLRAHAAVNDATVMLREDQPGIKRLVAYIATANHEGEGATTLIAELRHQLGQHLPEHMLPSAYVLLEKFPLLPSGKLNRNALPEPGLDVLRERSYEPPTTPTEIALAGIWQEVLKAERIGIHDNFFQLGGDSIVSLLIVAQAAKIGMQFATSQLFRYLTIAQLAKAIDEAAASQHVGLLPSQQQIFAQPARALAAFNWIRLEPRRTLDPKRLQQAMESLIQRHEAMRLRFFPSEMGWRAQTTDASTVLHSFSLEDLSALDKDAWEMAVAGLAAAANPDGAPLFKLWLHRPDGHDAQLILACHPLIADGLALRQLVEEHHATYLALENDGIYHPDESKLNWHGLTTRLGQLTKAEAASAITYWSEQAARPLALMPGFDLDHASSVTIRLDAEATRRLEAAAPAYQVTLDELLLTALTLVLAQHTGAGYHMLWTHSDLRRGLDAYEVAGMIANFDVAHPLPLDLTGTQGAGAALVRIKEQVRKNRSVITHHALLAQLPGGPEIIAKLPMPRVSFHMREPRSIEGLEIFGKGYLHMLSQVDERFNLVLNVERDGPELVLSWCGNADNATLARFETDYRIHLETLVAHCLSAEGSGLTASDFLDVDISDEDLGALLDKYGE